MIILNKPHTPLVLQCPICKPDLQCPICTARLAMTGSNCISPFSSCDTARHCRKVCFSPTPNSPKLDPNNPKGLFGQRGLFRANKKTDTMRRKRRNKKRKRLNKERGKHAVLPYQPHNNTLSRLPTRFTDGYGGRGGGRPR